SPPFNLSIDRSLTELQRVLHECSYRQSTRPYRDLWLLVLDPRITRNIEVYPRRLLDELFQEHCRRNRAAPTSAGVLDICDIGLDQFVVLRVNGQSPHLFARTLHCLRELVEIVLIIA